MEHHAVAVCVSFMSQAKGCGDGGMQAAAAATAGTILRLQCVTDTHHHHHLSLVWQETSQTSSDISSSTYTGSRSQREESERRDGRET